MISVIIAAYNEQDRIEECLDSVSKQSIDKSVYLGIDNCALTKDKVLAIRHKYKWLRIFWFPQRTFKYAIVNTMVTKSSDKFLCFFDADDIMHDDMLERYINVLSNGNDIFVYGNSAIFHDATDIDKHNGVSKINHGVFGISKEAFLRVNGFWPWRCAADTEFRKRLSRNGINGFHINESLFKRRIHSDSLMRNKNTNGGSPLRKTLRKKIKVLLKFKIQKLTLEVVDCEEI